MSSTQDLLSAALAYAQLGYRVFPCKPGEKVPACAHGCKDATADEGQIRRWWSIVPHNIGLATDELVVLDVEAAGRPWLESLPADQQDSFDGSPHQSTPGGGLHFVFQQDGRPVRNSARKVAPDADIRADGGYIVVAPSVVNGKAYEWIVSPCPAADLPQVPRWIEEAATTCIRPATAPTATPRPLETAGPDALSRCAAYLDVLPPAVQGQDGSTATLRACRVIWRFGLSETDARRAFDHFNCRCQPPWTCEKEIAHKLADARKIVERDGEFGAWLERGREWERYTGPDVDLSGILGRLTRPQMADEGPTADDNCRRSDIVSKTIPDWLLRPQGFLREVIDYTLATALYPQPEMALAGALALLSVLTGRKVADKRDTRTNLYIVTVGPTRSGKDHPREINKRILYRAAGQEMIGAERIGSHAGLITAVEKAPAVLFQLDEVGRFIATTRDPKKATHLYNVPSVLMSLYSSAKSIWIADAYADAKKTKTIDQPHCVLHGTTTGEVLWGNLSQENVADGLVGRLLIFNGRGYVPFNETAENAPVPESIVMQAGWWVAHQPGRAGANLAKFHPIPDVVAITPEAEAMFMEHVRAINERRIVETQFRAAVWSGTAEKTAKLALLHACSRVGRTPEAITADDMTWGKGLSNYLTRTLLTNCLDELASNEWEAAGKRLLKLIGDRELTLKEIGRATRHLKPRERRDLLDDLVENGWLHRELIKTDGRTKQVFRRRLLGPNFDPNDEAEKLGEVPGPKKTDRPAQLNSLLNREIDS